MSDIDDRLKVLADSKEHDDQCIAHGEGLDCCIEKPKIIAAIKQVFASEGFTGLMSGQEFYERFKQEFMADKSVYYYGDMLAVVRRAAGLES